MPFPDEGAMSRAVACSFLVPPTFWLISPAAAMLSAHAAGPVARTINSTADGTDIRRTISLLIKPEGRGPNGGHAPPTIEPQLFVAWEPPDRYATTPWSIPAMGQACRKVVD